MNLFKYLKEFYGKQVLRCYCNIVKSLHVYGCLSLKLSLLSNCLNCLNFFSQVIRES